MGAYLTIIYLPGLISMPNEEQSNKDSYWTISLGFAISRKVVFRAAYYRVGVNGSDKIIPCLLRAAIPDASQAAQGLSYITTRPFRVEVYESSTRLAAAVHGIDEADWPPVPETNSVHAGCIGAIV